MISKLHYITQAGVAGFDHAQLAEQACKGGVDWVQVRVKNESMSNWINHVKETKQFCEHYNAKLIVNDNPQLALDCGADGIHVGKEDMPIAEVRKLLGANFIIGGTANDEEDVLRIFESGGNYVGIGPFRFTQTKEKLSAILGAEGYQRVLEYCDKHNITIPLIAIGGIKKADVKPLLALGMHGVAIASEINLANDKVQAAREFVQLVR